MNHKPTPEATIPGLVIEQQGLFRVVSAPSHGRQDVGHSPGGPSDRFGMRTGNILLGQDDYAPALEVIFTSGIVFTAPTVFTLTGAPRPKCTLRQTAGGKPIPVPHAQVIQANPGDRLVLGAPSKGLRTYLCVRPSDQHTPALIGRTRPSFASISSFLDPVGAIRVTQGPEFDRLIEASCFFNQPWRLTGDMSDLGLTFQPISKTNPQLPVVDPPEITSAPVNDGTIQLTPNGPLILLRQRPTLGGYPRIGSVIDVDIDLLAQHRPHQAVKFQLIQPEEALLLYQQQDAALTALRDRL